MPRKRIKVHVKRLRRAIRDSYRVLQPFRDVNYESIRQMVGQWYGNQNMNEPIPINLIEEAIGIYSRLMAARAPGVIVKSPYSADRKLATESYLLKRAIEAANKEMRLREELEMVAKDALFSVGIVQTGANPAVEQNLRGMYRSGGSPFVERISIQDFAQDMTAKRRSQRAWIANRYRLPFDQLQDSKLFGRKTARLKPTEDKDLGRDGVLGPETLSRGQGYLEPYRDYIDLWDVYVTDINTIVTIPDSEEGFGDEELDSYIWEGLDGGPYRELDFNTVPDQLMPLAPAALWLDLHHVANRLLNKIIEQAQRQKTVGVYAPGAGDDAKRVLDAQDGEMIRSDRPEATREARFGGIDTASLATFLQIKQLFSDAAGNLDLLGGISPQSETATQDQILNANASRRAQAMIDRFEGFTKEVVSDVGFILYTDPQRDIELQLESGFDERTVSFRWRAEDRVGDFFQHNIDIVPYSTRDKSPAETLDIILRSVREAVALAQINPNFTIDTQRLFEIIAEYSNTPELMQIIRFREPGQFDTASGGEPAKSPVTVRREERISLPGATRAGNDGILTQALLTGGAVQPKEMAALGRSTGGARRPA